MAASAEPRLSRLFNRWSDWAGSGLSRSPVDAEFPALGNAYIGPLG